MEHRGSRTGLQPWAVLALTVLGLIAVLWAWAGIRSIPESGDIQASGTQATAHRDDGLVWHVTEFRPGRRAEVRLDIRRRGPLPVRVRAASEIDAGPPRTNLCGWWPDQVLLDGQDLADQEPFALPRNQSAELIVSGTFLGEPGCLDDGRIGAHRSVGLAISVVGAPKRVRVHLPVVLAWSNNPASAAERLTERSVAPRVGTAP